MASMRHPVAGDALYGAPKELKRVRTKAPTLSRKTGERVGQPASQPVLTLERNFLHAAAIEFKQPRTGELLKFGAPLPQELVGFFEELRR
jgi:23S rRNA-/tRNA-specific pseudouridylate synthase